MENPADAQLVTAEEQDGAQRKSARKSVKRVAEAPAAPPKARKPKVAKAAAGAPVAAGAEKTRKRFDGTLIR
jgi:hypothetical protein